MKERNTIIKKIVDQYLVKTLNYNLQTQLFFDESVEGMDGRISGYTDIEIRLDGRHTDIIIEAKRNGKKLGEYEKKQAVEYGKSRKVTCVVVTNGNEYVAYNSNTTNRLRINGRLLDDIPRCVDLPLFLRGLGINSDNVVLTIDMCQVNLKEILRPSMENVFQNEGKRTVADLEHIFRRCHNILRAGEKMTPEVSFEEFSKILFLKLYSETIHSKNTLAPKIDAEKINTFESIAEQESATTVRTLVTSNFDTIMTAYRDDVFDDTDVFRIKKPKTFKEIVNVLARVNFTSEIDADIKGRAYEHFLATVLRGSKLGQFFTPRPVVNMMVRLVDPKPGDLILDPACGSGGFLIKAMQSVGKHIDCNPHERESNKMDRWQYLKDSSLFGCDGGMVAKTAKMNMVLVGDGHTNITREDSLTEDVPFLKMDEDPFFDIILTNPPFGLDEKLTKPQLERYDIPKSKAQSLFLQLIDRAAGSRVDALRLLESVALSEPSFLLWHGIRCMSMALHQANKTRRPALVRLHKIVGETTRRLENLGFPMDCAVISLMANTSTEVSKHRGIQSLAPYVALTRRTARCFLSAEDSYISANTSRLQAIFLVVHKDRLGAPTLSLFASGARSGKKCFVLGVFSLPVTT